MGVVIRAYSRLELTDPHHFDPDACYDDGHHQAFAYGGFEQSLRGLEPGRCYAETGETVRLEISAMSYTGYNLWREALCRAALGVKPTVVFENPDAYRDRPLFELLNFADNEGTIGPDAAADLLADFQAAALSLSDQVAEYIGGQAADFYRPFVGRWVEGLALAADAGLVSYS